MKALYLECNMGAAGDMLTAALLELVPDKQLFISRMNSLGIEGLSVSASEVLKMGVKGTQMNVLINGEEEHSVDVTNHHHEHEADEYHHHEHETDNHHHHHEHEKDEHHHVHEHTHSHSSLKDISEIISHLNVSKKVRNDAVSVYKIIAEAESYVHGRTVDEIHFHEVGNMDAIADIVGVCILMEMISPDRTVVSPVHVGSGSVRCAHGILPVPAPAAAHILNGIPVYSGSIEGELCTPTGAALLKYFADDFGGMPQMRISGTGCGMGKKDFPKLNCLRAFTGESENKSEQVIELICNIDDMTGEELGYAQEILMNSGACDVFTTSVGMKKNRPGILLTCVCRTEQRDEMLGLIFKHTSTIGVREHVCERYVLRRSTRTVSTDLGDVRVKYSEGYGVKRSKPEYDDIVRIAGEKGLSYEQILEIINKSII